MALLGVLLMLVAIGKAGNRFTGFLMHICVCFNQLIGMLIPTVRELQAGMALKA